MLIFGKFVLTFLASLRFFHIRKELAEKTNQIWLLRLVIASMLFLIINDGMGYITIPLQQKSLVIVILTSFLTIYYLFNFQKIYILLLVLGSFSNHITIAVNGYMPVSKEAVVKMTGKIQPTNPDGFVVFSDSESKKVMHVKYINESSKLVILSDILYFPYAGAVFSVGDLFIWMSSPIFLLMTRKLTSQ